MTNLVHKENLLVTNLKGIALTASRGSKMMSIARAKLGGIKKFAISLLVAQFFDIFTTYIFMSLGGQEGNPFMAPILVGGASFATMLLIKVSIAVLILHSINLRITRYKIKEARRGPGFNIDLKMKEKAYGLTIMLLAMTYWVIIGWNCMGIYFLLT